MTQSNFLEGNAAVDGEWLWLRTVTYEGLLQVMGCTHCRSHLSLKKHKSESLGWIISINTYTTNWTNGFYLVPFSNKLTATTNAVKEAEWGVIQRLAPRLTTSETLRIRAVFPVLHMSVSVGETRSALIGNISKKPHEHHPALIQTLVNPECYRNKTRYHPFQMNHSETEKNTNTKIFSNPGRS